MKQSIDSKVAVGILLVVVVLAVSVFVWRGMNGLNAEATGGAGAPRHIKPGGPSAFSGSPSSTTPGNGQ